MSLKGFYQNCIDECNRFIEENNHKIEILEEAKIVVANEESKEEMYLSERNKSISKLQMAHSYGVIEYGENLSQYISYSYQVKTLSYYTGIKALIEKKIEQLLEENFQMGNDIERFGEKITQIEKEENETIETENANNKK